MARTVVEIRESFLLQLLWLETLPLSSLMSLPLVWTPLLGDTCGMSSLPLVLTSLSLLLPTGILLSFLFIVLSIFASIRKIYWYLVYSMEECDALSSRIGIMSQGELVCLGTSQHLKSRFASGYSIQLKTQDYNLERVKNHIANTFPLACIADEHGGILLKFIISFVSLF